MDLGRRLREALAKFTGKPVIDKDAVKSLIKDLQRTLIAGDVDVHLVLRITKEIERRALEEEAKGIDLRTHVVKIVYDELVKFLGESHTPDINNKKILLVGLYGSGKTTTAAKLARFYKSRGKRVLLVCADTDRPAAYDQLKQLAGKAGIDFFGIPGERDSIRIVREALKKETEVMIVDSSGRSALDEDLMNELRAIKKVLEPDEVLLIVSADIGQVAGKQAEAFQDAVSIDGIIITKADSSAKAGGALSAAHATGAKVFFIGTGEQIDDFQPYNSKKYVARLLGFPDLEALLEKVRRVQEEAELKDVGEERLTLRTFLEQLKAARKMGPLKNVMSMMGAPDIPDELVAQSEEKMRRFEAIINSMTPEERENPELVKRSQSRMERIAQGSGTSVQEVRELLRQFDMINKMVKGFKHDRKLRKQLEKMMKGKGFRFF
ncbi:MAG: signal recognition particle receptor subunit alpha [Candidatus Asgardarchaeia archaeon]